MLITALVFLLNPLSAQYQFEIFTDADGLPAKQVRGLDVDSENTLWIGTKEGLAKWDGQIFTAIPPQDGVTDPYCKVVRVAPNGNIWVGYFTSPTEGGISVYSPDGQLVMHADTSNVDLGSNMITDIEFDENGTAWIAHIAGITTYDGVAWNFMPPESTNYSAAPVNDIEFDENGGYYVSTVFGLMHYNGSSWTYYLSFNSNIANSQVRKATIAEDGRVWTGTHGGLSILENGIFDNYILNDGLPSEQIRDIQFDSFGNAWLATEDGFSVFDGDTFDNYETIMGDLLDNTIDNILIHDELGVWMTTRDGLVRVTQGGVGVFDKTNLVDAEMILYPSILKNGQTLNFSINGLENDRATVLVLDVHGRPVFYEQITMWGQEQLALLLPDLEAGMYVLQVQQEGLISVGQRFFVVD